MTRKAIRNAMILAAVAVLTGFSSARAQERLPDSLPSGVTLLTPECTGCPNDAGCPKETRSGLIPRIQKQTVARREEKKHEETKEACGEKVNKSKWRKLCDWLTYRPEHQGLKCSECKHCAGSCYTMPLWTFFPCQGSCYGSVVAGANPSCAKEGCAAGCKTCGGTAPTTTSNEPCLICRFHKD